MPPEIPQRPAARPDLAALVATRWRAALADGALEPIATRTRYVREGGIRFAVRVVSTLARRHAARVAQSAAEQRHGRRIDPFQPWEPAMFVADLSPTHVALLNKFPVLDHHLLIVTREFEHQECLLGRADFEALAVAMAAVGGLAFYNAGGLAGASQDHKHLQLVPLPLAGRGRAIPVTALFDRVPVGRAVHLPRLPFPHAYVRLARHAPLASGLDDAYRAALAALGIGARRARGAARQSAPYNLLATRRWLLAVPRTAERCEGVAINALGFAGALLVCDTEHLARVIGYGPLHMLQAVTGRRPQG